MYRKCKQCGKKFRVPKSKPNQVDCKEICLCNRFDKLIKKTRWIARVYALTMGYRSMSEVRFAAKLKDANIPFEYETDTFDYQYKPQKYTPDFVLTAANGKDIFFEYKGKLDQDTRKKMRAVKASNPRMDIRFIFEKPNNKLYKGAKMRYWEWAERNGFKWYDHRNINKIKRDLKACITATTVKSRGK